MKRFLKYCTLFIIPLAVVLASLEYALRQVPNPYKYKYEWMQNNAAEVETIVLGSSHTFYGIRPEYLDGNSFNLANVSQDLGHDLFLLKYWADRYDSLKTVIVPISYFTWFGKGLHSGSESYRCRYYSLYMDSDDYPTLSLERLEISDFNTAKNKMQKIFNQNTDPEYDNFGWGNLYTLSTKNMEEWDSKSEAARAVKRHYADDWSTVEANYDKLREMAELCNKLNAQLVLISTPCNDAYNELLVQAQVDKMYETTDRFIKEFNVPYLDYREDPRFEADDFYDSNHLSDIGAAKFTKILNQDLITQVLRVREGL
jgi:hypothetical protein